ncbi:MAG TPA: efflux RND transporter periplasmic adaptor subunit [Cyclobacteriaceae bacterium]|nr:efflux RND transporter periplasmic adaptor subunit [Cyclobacteriaceae bacterium]
MKSQVLYGVSAVLLATLLNGCSNSTESIAPQVKPLIEAVYASGHTASASEYMVNALALGYISEKLVKEGDTVKKGQVLYVISSEQQQSRYKLVQEAYRIAKENYSDDSAVLSEIKAAIASTLNKLKFDSANYVRFQNLLAQNATTKSEYERMKLAYENTGNELKLQQSRLSRTKSQLFLELQQAESQLRSAREESGHYQISSQIDGIVFNTMKEPGELVRQGEPLAQIGRAEDFFIRLSVDELDIQRIKTGQQILVKIDAYPDKIFKAAITRIHPMVNPREQSIRVDAKFSGEIPEYYNGLALEANIIIRQKENALVLPKKVLRGSDSLLIKTSDGLQKIKIKKGLETLDEVEILEGINQDSEIIIAR